MVNFCISVNLDGAWTYYKNETYLKRYFAQTMQWMGSDGVFLMVHPGKVFWVGLGWHS